MGANQVQIPVIQTENANLTQTQQNTNKVLRNIYNQVVEVQNSVGGLNFLEVNSLIANQTLTENDDVAFGNAAKGAFTVTLPNPVGIKGKVFYLKKTDSTFNVITINATNSTFTKNLSTQGEAWEFVSDGMTYQTLSHRADIYPLAYTPTITGLGTNTDISFLWQRSSNNLMVFGTAITGTVAASLASITLPSGLSLDTAAISISNTTSAAGMLVGNFSCQNTNSSGRMVTATATSTTIVYFGSEFAGSSSIQPNNGSAIMGSSKAYSLEFSVPISGWNS